MRSITFPEANLPLAEDQPEYETLHVHLDVTKPEVPMTACFELNKEEIEEIVRTGKIWFTQWTFGSGFQPIKIQTENPFEENVGI